MLILTYETRGKSLKKFVITKSAYTYISYDLKGLARKFENRRYACFLITLKGKIRFSFSGEEVISEPGSPVFLPQGSSYTNECLEDAESYVFNFETLDSYEKPMKLSPISEALASEYYRQINLHSMSSSLQDSLVILETLYSLSSKLLRKCEETNNANPLIDQAILFMKENYSRTGLTVGDVAKALSISEVYLRKLFSRELKSSPHRELTAIRMKKARFLITEKRPLSEVAESVGYSDVSAFNRAYKHYYGFPPSRS
jgi:AraC-like DNA-binding protein